MRESNLRFVLFFILFVLISVSLSAEAKNLSLGSKYTYKPDALYALTRDQHDSSQLTDGYYTKGHFWTSLSTVGWHKTGEIQIEIDLGATRHVEKVCVNTARGNHADVFFPERLELFLSNDKKSYKNMGDIYQDEDHKDGPYLVKKYCLNQIHAEGQFVLIVVQPRGDDKFTFIDEIEVLGDDELEIKGRDNINVVKREEITGFLKTGNKLRHQKEMLVNLAKNLGVSQGFLDDLEAIKQIDELKKHEDILLKSNLSKLSSTFKNEIIIWRNNPWQAFRPIDRPQISSVIKSDLMFDLMRNGSASNAFILTNNTEEIQVIKIVSEPGDISVSPRIYIREVIPVITSDHDFIGDALQSIVSGEIKIRPGESKQIWLTVFSDNVNSGIYKRNIKLTSTQNTLFEKNVTLSINVWPVDFPLKQQLYSNAWAYLSWRPIKNIPELATEDLLNHHVNIAVLHPWQIPWPGIKQNKIKTDYSKSDKILSYQKNADKRLFFFDFNKEIFRTFNHSYDFMSVQWKQLFKVWIVDWVAHLKKQGLGYKDFAFYPVDEPMNKDEINYLMETARFIKKIDPKLEVFTTLGRLNVYDLVQARQVVDIFQLLVSDSSSIEFSTLKGMDKEVWLYTIDGQKNSSPLEIYRLQAWIAFQLGAKGVGFWSYADTGAEGTAWNDFDGKRPDYSVIYEGDNGIISSKRWEAWREGIEDYELLLQVRKKLKTINERSSFEDDINKVINNIGDIKQLHIIRSKLFEIVTDEI